MSGIELDAAVFGHHLKTLVKNWKSDKERTWRGADAVCLPVGKFDNDAVGFPKTMALHLYLFGYEFNNTIIVLTADTLHIAALEKRVDKYLKPLVERSKAVADGMGMKFSLYKLSKKKTDEADKANAAVFDRLAGVIKAAGSKVGVVPKDVKKLCAGKIVARFVTALNKLAPEVEQVNATSGLASLFAVKDATEVDKLKQAASICAKVLKKGLLDKIETVIDDESERSHRVLCDEVEALLEQNSKKLKLGGGLDPQDVEPISMALQSGGKYTLKYRHAQPSEKNLAGDVVVADVALRYKSYCANLARTYLIDPSKSQKATYTALLAAYEAAAKALKPGAAVSSVYAAARSALARSAQPASADKLMPDVGFGIGIEAKESVVLNSKNPTVVKPGMTFVLRLGLKDIPHAAEKGKAGAASMDVYSLLVSNTIVVQAAPDDKTGLHAMAVTRATMKWDSVAYFIEADEEEDEDEEGDVAAPTRGREAVGSDQGKVLGRRLREKPAQNAAAAAGKALQEKQLELMRRKKEEMERHLAQKSADKKFNPNLAKARAKIRAYKTPGEYPEMTRRGRVLVDIAREAVLLPIHGTPVPFHIFTIKNASLDQSDRASFLRLNFYSPAQNFGRDAPPAMVAQCEANKGKLMYIKELTFRARNGRNLQTQLRLIKELQKRTRARLREAKEKEDLVEQADLKPIKNPPRLMDLNMKPNLSGRKTQGTLEAHKNGLRFRSLKGEKCDFLYNNVKHAFFQPCEHELIVLMHFHLRNPIIIGKKKCWDIQFYTEVVEKSLALAKAKGSMYDPDELDEEQRERKLRKKLNQVFTKFMRKAEQLVEAVGKDTLEFDIPYREMGFNGSPFKEMVLLQPSRDALVCLTESPQFVMTLADIEHVHFERVNMSGNSFDLVAIRKNYDHPKGPVHTITAIPMLKLQDVQAWLTEIDQTYTTGTANLNWKAVMKSRLDDDIFWDDTDPSTGKPKPIGWQCLDSAWRSESDEEDEDSGSNFSDDMVQDSSSEEDEWDSDASNDEDDEEDDDEDDDGEEGQSWDDLERAARDADKRKRGFGGDEEFERSKKKSKKVRRK